MAKYFVKKGIQLIIVTILISFFSFAVIYAAPGDISGMYLNEQMSDEEKEAIRENLGLNKSMPEQYWGWAKEVLKGDFGISLANHTSVSEQIIKRLPATLQLMGAALVLSVLLAIPLGLWSGYRKNTWIDNIISGLSYIGMSIPSFWLGMVLIIVFAAKLHILPSSGWRRIRSCSKSKRNDRWKTFKKTYFEKYTASDHHIAWNESGIHSLWIVYH